MYVNNWDNENGKQETPEINRWTPPVREPNQSMYTAALILGVITLVSAVMMTVYLPFVFGGLSIIFGILSRGQNRKLPGQAKTGIIIAVAGLVLNIGIIAGSFYLVFNNPEVRKQFDITFEQMYGESFDEMMEDIKNGRELDTY